MANDDSHSASDLAFAELAQTAIRGLGPRYVYRYNDEAVCGTLAQYALAWQHTGTTPEALSPEVIAAEDGQCFTVKIDELDSYDNAITSGIVYRFTAGDDVIEHRIPDTIAPEATTTAGRARNGEVLIALLDESHYSSTGKRVQHVREVAFRVHAPTQCDHHEGSICGTCAPGWQLDYAFHDDRFPFPRTRRVRIAELIEAGTLRPGQKIGLGTGDAGVITSDGGLLLPDGRIFDNPAAAKNAITCPRPTQANSGDLLEVPPDCWHVEQIPHYPATDRVVVVAIDATSASEAEQRTIAWARRPDSGITEIVGNNAAKAKTAIDSDRWTVVLDITVGQR
ncbi:hypothetical protein ACQPW1_39520 [Nocardia sp. CA-128927]|uniref:hypothetical protein n=1 Tax=Nocardia sp. CA-128927 TaxID=3239975 RepID=UPI003D99CF5E